VLTGLRETRMVELRRGERVQDRGNIKCRERGINLTELERNGVHHPPAKCRGTASKLCLLVLRRLRSLFRGRNPCVGSLTGKPAAGSPYGDIGEAGER